MINLKSVTPDIGIAERVDSIWIVDNEKGAGFRILVDNFMEYA